MIITDDLRRLSVATAACVLLAACGDGLTRPGDSRVEIVSGDGQRSLPNWRLEDEVVVRVVNGGGEPVSDVALRFTASDGGRASPLFGSTDASGVAGTTWFLGPQTLGTQTLEASISGGVAAATLEATVLGPGETDLVVVHGALEPLTGIVVVREDPGRLNTLGYEGVSDTLIAIPPADGPGKEIVLFGLGNRPLRTAPAWTPAVDTVHVTMQPPVVVDIDFDVRAGNFAARRQIQMDQLDAMEDIWASEGMGLVLGTVTFTDNTTPGVDAPIVSNGLCSGLVPESAIEVDLVTSIDDGDFLGWGCWSGHVFMAIGSERAPNLLAHELGHTFTLEHTGTGMMRSSGPQRDVREGETFRAHFYQWSALNRIFSSQPSSLHRDCSIAARCLNTTLDLRSGPGVPAVAGAPLPALPTAPPSLPPVDAVGHRARR